jgi:DNA-binding transcriptional ArsR family regulator
MPEPSQRPYLATSEPERIRALAHPLRLALLELLDDEGEATATRCSEATGESVASCSFHLRMLAKYGYVEEAGRRGREKPWRSVTRHREVRPDPADPASVRATEALAALTVDQETARIHSWLATAAAEAAQWLGATTVAKSAFWATAEELAAVSEEVQALANRFAGRWEDPSQRPPGARVARLFAVVNPDPPDGEAHRYGPGRGGRS